MSKAFNAAKSLFNSTALSGMIGGQKREQTVLTPEWLLEAIRAVAPIGLDPCTTPENPCKAATAYTEDYDGGRGGLSAVWGVDAPVLSGECIYVNPHYAKLKEWIRQCYLYAEQEKLPIYLLAPFRPQRKWFCEYTRGYEVVSLAPFPFVGHKQAFPAPLCLVCYNLPLPNLGKYETGRWSVK